MDIIYFTEDKCSHNFNTAHQIKVAWEELLKAENKIIAYAQRISKAQLLEMEMVGLHYADLYFNAETIELFLKFLSKGGHGSHIFIFEYKNGYVAFSGHNEGSLRNHLQMLTSKMLAESFGAILAEEEKLLQAL